MQSRASIVVIGGGVIGCSVAYHLTEWQDASVILLEKREIGKGETAVSAAMVMHQTQDKLTTSLAKASIQEYLDLSSYVGRNAGFHQVGSILYATDPIGAEKIRDIVRTQEKLGIPTELLVGSEVQRYAPMVHADDMLAASYCHLDGYLDQFRLVKAYAKYAGQHGVEIRENVEAIGIDVDDGHVRGVQTTAGYIETSIVVNAAGAAARRIGHLAGVEIPIMLNKRDIVVLTQEPYKGPIMEDITTEWYFRPYNGYTLAGVGPTKPLAYLPESSEADTEPDVATKVSEFFARRAPSLASSPIGGKWGGIRSLTPDGLPILGPVNNVKGFLNCCGLSGFGVTNAPIAGKIIAEVVGEGRAKSFDLQPFSLERFPAQWQIKKDHLMIGEETVLEVAKRFGTPTYLYDANIILDRLKRVKRVLPEFEIWYSVKANPNPAILKIFADFGEGVTVTSLTELRQALLAGFPINRVALGGPGKGPEELEYAIKAGVSTIDVESPRELMIIEEIGNKLRTQVRVSLRVNTILKASRAGEYMAGIPTKFGFDEETITDDLTGLDLQHVAIEGIHAHAASQVLDSAFFLRHYEKVAKLAEQLASELAFDLKFINFGGGLGIPYSVNDRPIDLQTLGRQLTEILSVEFTDLGRNRPRFQVEFGRYLVAESGVFLTEIVDVKSSRGSTFVITDSGISGFSRPAMPWAQQHPCSIVTKEDLPPTGVYTIVGPSCLPSDVLCERAMLSNPTPGDILAMHGAGAYGYTMTMLFWSGIRSPKEVLFRDNELRVVRERLETIHVDEESGTK